MSGGVVPGLQVMAEAGAGLIEGSGATSIRPR